MKKFLVSFIFIILIFPGFSYADEDDFEELTWEELDDIKRVSAEITDEPKIDSRAAIVIEKNSKRVLYEKNGYEKRAMASTTNAVTP